eukprot:ANDGO_01725.mRNA.1 Sperm receptor for egg jelly
MMMMMRLCKTDSFASLKDYSTRCRIPAGGSSQIQPSGFPLLIIFMFALLTCAASQESFFRLGGEQLAPIPGIVDTNAAIMSYAFSPNGSLIILGESTLSGGLALTSFDFHIGSFGPIVEIGSEIPLSSDVCTGPRRNFYVIYGTNTAVIIKRLSAVQPSNASLVDLKHYVLSSPVASVSCSVQQSVLYIAVTTSVLSYVVTYDEDSGSWNSVADGIFVGNSKSPMVRDFSVFVETASRSVYIAGINDKDRTVVYGLQNNTNNQWDLLTPNGKHDYVGLGRMPSVFSGESFSIVGATSTGICIESYLPDNTLPSKPKHWTSVGCLSVAPNIASANFMDILYLESSLLVAISISPSLVDVYNITADGVFRSVVLGLPCASSVRILQNAAGRVVVGCGSQTWISRCPGHATCSSCPLGTFIANPTQWNASCLLCPMGTFSSTPGLTYCSKCPAGTYGPASGANSSSSCSLCPAGTYSTAVGSTASSTCLGCPIGTYSSATGAPSPGSCTPCQAGSYASGFGSQSCTLCPRGTVGVAVGANSSAYCQPCPSGTFGLNEGASAPTDCTLCPNNTYSSVSGSDSVTSCHPCPLGTFTRAQGASSASACIAPPPPSNNATAMFISAGIDSDATLITISFSSSVTSAPLSSSSCNALLLPDTRAMLAEGTDLACVWFNSATLFIHLGQSVIWSSSDPYFNISFVPGAVKDASTHIPVDIPSRIHLHYVPPTPDHHVSVAEPVVGICDSFNLSSVLISGSVKRLVSVSWSVVGMNILGSAVPPQLPYELSTATDVQFGQTIPFSFPGNYTIVFKSRNFFGLQYEFVLNLTRRSTGIVQSLAILGPSSNAVRISSPLVLKASYSTVSCVASWNLSFSAFWNVTGPRIAGMTKTDSYAMGFKEIEFTIPPYRLPASQNYSVSVKLVSRPLNVFTAIAEYAFAVVSLPLVSVIDQGSYIEQCIESDLKLTAQSCSDPEEEPVPEQFVWSCIKLKNNTTSSQPNGNASNFKPCGNVFGNNTIRLNQTVIYADTLQMNMMYWISVKYSKGSRQSISTIFVSVKPGRGSNVQIVVRSPRVNPSEKVTLTARMNFPPGDAATPVSFFWRLTSRSVEFDLSNRSVVLSNRTCPNLVIAPGFFIPGRVYLFEVFAVDSLGRESKAVRDISVRLPPKGGGCNVSPSEGVEMETDFTVFCSGWNVGDGPVQFDVYLINQNISGLPVLPVSSYSSDSSLLLPNVPIDDTKSLRLPAALNSEGHITLIFVIRDAFCAAVERSVNLTVRRKFFATPELRVHYLTAYAKSALVAARESADVRSMLVLFSSVGQSLTIGNSAQVEATSAILSSANVDDSLWCSGCVNGHCLRDGEMSYCGCQLGWRGPFCDISKAEVVVRSDLTYKLLTSLLNDVVVPVQSWKDRNEQKQLLRAITDSLLAVANNPLFIDDVGLCVMESILSKVAKTLVITGLDSSMFAQFTTALSSFVVSKGLGESSALKLVASHQGRNRTDAALRAGAAFTEDLVRQLATSAAATLSSGEIPLETDTGAFFFRIQVHSQTEIGGQRFDVSGDSFACRDRRPYAVIPVGMNPCQHANVLSSSVIYWKRNPFSNCLAQNETALSHQFSVEFYDQSGTECVVKDLARPVEIFLPLIQNISRLQENTSTPKCAYFDVTNGNYSVSGVVSTIVRDPFGVAYGVLCSTTHLTSFATIDFQVSPADFVEISPVDIADTGMYTEGDLLHSYVFYVILSLLLCGWLLMAWGYALDRRQARRAGRKALPTSITPYEPGQFKAAAAVPELNADSFRLHVCCHDQKAHQSVQLGQANAVRRQESPGMSSSSASETSAAGFSSTTEDLTVFGVEYFSGIAESKGDAKPSLAEKWMIFRMNVVSVFRQTHPLFGLRWGDGESGITRPQRVMLLMCFVFCALALNAFFHPSAQSPLWVKIAITAMCALIAEPVVFFLSFLFGRIARDAVRRRETSYSAANTSVTTTTNMPAFQQNHSGCADASQKAPTDVGVDANELLSTAQPPFMSTGHSSVGIQNERVSQVLPVPPSTNVLSVCSSSQLVRASPFPFSVATLPGASIDQLPVVGDRVESASLVVAARVQVKTNPSSALKIVGSSSIDTSPVAGSGSGRSVNDPTEIAFGVRDSTLDLVEIQSKPGLPLRIDRKRSVSLDRLHRLGGDAWSVASEDDSGVDVAPKLDETCDSGSLPDFRSLEMSGARLRWYESQMELIAAGRVVRGPVSYSNLLIILFAACLLSLFVVFWLLQASCSIEIVVMCVALLVLISAILIYVIVWKRRPRLTAECLLALARHESAFWYTFNRSAPQQNAGSQFYFPPSSVIFVYFLAILLQVFCIHIILLYYVRMNKDEQFAWYLCSLATFGQQLFVLEPVCILVRVAVGMFM